MKHLKKMKRQMAFSLVELLVAVSLLSLIVFGLYSMFDQTQSALRSNISQVDVLEAGRAAIEIIVSDLQQATASGIPISQIQSISPERRARFSHFRVSMNSANSENGANANSQNGTMPVLQRLADGSVRTNLIQESYFLTRPNLNWVAKGFFLSASSTNQIQPIPPSPALPYGTLFRFSSLNISNEQFAPQRRMDISTLPNFFLAHTIAKRVGWFGETNVIATPLIEGVVHFKIQPMDSFGRPMNYWTNNPTAETINRLYGDAVSLRKDTSLPPQFAETQSAFYENALPAFLDVELGVLDQATLERAKSFDNHTLARRFLEKQAGGVYLFRRMISLRGSIMARNLLQSSQ